MKSYHYAKFGGHSHSGSGIMILVCHVISQDHVIKRSRNFMGGSPHGKSPPCQPPGHKHGGCGDMFLVVQG